jgi:hypothetical protein
MDVGLRSLASQPGEVLRALGSHARYGVVLISPQIGFAVGWRLTVLA